VSERNCRFCGRHLEMTLVDLGMSPFSNAFVPPSRLSAMEPFFPLHVWVCDGCFLVQLEAFETPDTIFNEDYAYFSSFSETWLAHARRYVAAMTERLGLGPKSLVVEVASNDGYLLQYFVERGVPVLGIEPSANVAAEAERRGVPSLVRFFGRETAALLAREGRQADLLVGNNVLAHVPDINGFVAGLQVALKPCGVITMEFPHLVQLLRNNQYDTIYHEHFSYLSLTTVEEIFAEHELVLFDVDEIPTHGGSLRVYARHRAHATLAVTESVGRLRAAEQAFGVRRPETYSRFRKRVGDLKCDVLEFLIRARREGRQVVGYGAPAKANTLLNYCGVGPELIAYMVDRSPHKQGRFLPGSRIPVQAPERMRETRPDYVVVMPWNIKDEILDQHAYVREWGGRFVVFVPEVRVLG